MMRPSLGETMARKTQKGAVLITGAAKRIGKTIALALAERGWDIAFTYKSSEKAARQTLADLRGKGIRAKSYSCDLFSEKETGKLIPAVKKDFPRLQVLINGASIFEPSELKDGDLRRLEENFRIHLFAPYTLSVAFAKDCKKGHIINIVDRSVGQNQSRYAHYLLSKKSLWDLTQMLCLEFAPRIRVNAVSPGAILLPEGKTNGYLKKVIAAVPVKRKGEPEEIASAVAFLIENGYINGQMIYVDGGEHLL